MRVVILLSVILGAFVGLRAQSIQFVNGTWEEILSLAHKEKKLVFVDAYTTWCAPCKVMSQNVFTKPEAGKFFNEHFINAKIDMEKGEGPELGLRYQVKAYPTLLFVDSEGTLVHRVAGYQSVEKLIHQGQTALDPSSRLSAMDERYEIGDRNPEFLLKYLETKYRTADGTHGQIAEEYLKTQKDWSAKKSMDVVFNYITDANSPMFDYLISNKARFDGAYGKNEVNRRIQSLIETKLSGTGAASLTEVQSLIKKIYAGTEGDKMASRIRLTYHRRQGNREGYATSAIEHYNNYPCKNADELNEVAWTFYEAIDDKKYLKKGVKFAKQSIALDNNYYNNDTLAALYFKLKKKKKAKKAAYSAIALAKAQEEDYSETENLLKKIEQM